ncbi:MAG: 30S ribosomal protein S8 [Oscillospiraceae bacterium]|nr:30S ribosomal protein S8 [Oscillospiraceae bacterium]
MQVTDAIADLLTRIRNAGMARIRFIELPASKIKKAISKVLVAEGYIRRYSCSNDGKQGRLRISLRYEDKKFAIKGLKRISKPGLRVYKHASELPKVMNGLGIAVVSTSKGVMTDRAARTQNVGGEVLAYIW